MSKENFNGTEIVNAGIIPNEISMSNLGNHIACPDCALKDQQIAELKADLKDVLKRLGEINEEWRESLMQIQEEKAKVYKLEQQLQEKDAEIEQKQLAIDGLQDINDSLSQTCNNDLKEIKRLEQQRQELLDKICKYEIIVNDRNSELEQLKQSQNQKAVNVLEKLKDIIVDKLEIYGYKGESIIGDELISSDELLSEIDRLKKELGDEQN